MLAFHFDLKHAMWSESYMNRFASMLAGWGYNTILYEVEDKFRFSRHAAIAHRDALSAAETGARMASLRKRGFTVIPMVQSLGHAEYVLTKPGYEHLRESPAHSSQYDPLSEESKALVCELIGELVDAIRPEDFFHLGGDETWNLGQSEKCKPVVADIGTGGLYLRHMLRIVEHVIRRGLRPVLWADIALTHPDIVAQFPREVVWMDWDYWTGGERWDSIRIWGKGVYTRKDLAMQDLPSFHQHLARFAIDEQTGRDGTFRGFYCTDALRDGGFDVIVAPATRCYGDTMGIPYNTVHLPNCFAAARKGRQAGLGACVTSWAVRHSHPEVNLPGAFAAAQAFAGGQRFDRTALLRTYTERHYGAAMPEFAEAVHQAEVRVPWSESREMPAPGKEQEALKAWLARVDQQPGGRAALCAAVESAATGFQAAEASLAAMRSKAKTNARNLDYWLEGVGYSAFCSAFARAALEERLAAEASSLREQLTAQRERTRVLFADTFPITSVNEELSIRYAFHEAILGVQS